MIRISLSSALFLLLLQTGLVWAASVYTWIDKNGATHFSDSPPPTGSIKVDQIELEEAPLIDSNLPPGYFSVINQAERMEARRLEYERIRAERLKAEAEATRAQAEAEAARERKFQQDFEVDNRRFTPLYPYTFFPRSRQREQHHPETVEPEEPAESVPAQQPAQRESHIRVR